MPRGDRTGPMGEGSMTGRAAGYCAGQDAPGCDNPSAGRGMGRRSGRGLGRGRGMGKGRGMRHGAPVPPAPDAASGVQALREQVADLQSRFDAVLDRVEGRTDEG